MMKWIQRMHWNFDILCVFCRYSGLPRQVPVCVWWPPTWLRRLWPSLGSSMSSTVAGWRNVSTTVWPEFPPLRSHGLLRPQPIRGQVEPAGQSRGTAIGRFFKPVLGLNNTMLFFILTDVLSLFIVGYTPPQYLETSVCSRRQRLPAGL